jgi:hypothetical protein
MTRRCLATALSALIILATLVAGPVQPASATPPAWWNASYSHRLGVSVMAGDALASGYSVSVTFNHATLVTAATSLASGDDVRIARWSGAAWTELDRVLAVGSSWNNASTKVYFRTQTGVSANTTDTSYYLYYGYPSAGAPPANANNVYDLYDDFSGGSLDGAKWTAYNGNTSVTGGELKIAGTADGGGGGGGIWSVGTYTSTTTGFIVESSMRLVSNPSGGNSWGACFGSCYMYPRKLGAATATVWYTNASNASVSMGSGTLTGTTSFSYQRVGDAFLPNGAGREFENGALVASASDVHSYNNGYIYFEFDPNVASATSDARFDDVVVRKYVANEPVTVLEQSSDTTVSLSMDPILAFTVSAVTGALSCGDATTTVASGTNTVNLGHMSSTTAHPIGGQSLNVATNAASGYTVSVSYSAAMSGASSGHPFANVGGTNASPAAWPSNGTEAFGYTTESSSLSGTAGRFHSNKWASLTTSGQEIMRNTTTPGVAGDTNCIAFQASEAANTPADAAYTTTVLYSVAPLF